MSNLFVIAPLLLAVAGFYLVWRTVLSAFQFRVGYRLMQSKNDRINNYGKRIYDKGHLNRNMRDPNFRAFMKGGDLSTLVKKSNKESI